MVAKINYSAETRRFASIQVARYLEDRPVRGFSGPAEYDAVLGIIKDAWVELRCSTALADLSSSGREALYWTTLIVFPSFVADSGLNCIPVDFISRQRVGEQVLVAPKRPVLELS